MISTRLKAIRQSSGHKQSYVAYKLGLSQTHVSQIESGHITPSIDVLERYAAFYGKPSVSETILKIFE